MRRIWFILAFVILVLGLFLYIYFGGFKEPEITVVEANQYPIIGYPYEGQMNVKAFGVNFTKADSLVNNGIIAGKVAGYFYNQPIKGDDKIRTFIGVIPSDTSVTVASLEKRIFPATRSIQATMESHYLIMPVNIYPRITEFAKENNLKISEESVEIYESDKKLIIRVPVL